jgi:hypothetical protein
VESRGRPEEKNENVGYEFEREEEARGAAAELDRRFSRDEISGLRVYRVRWNNEFIVEANFTYGLPEDRIADARAILGEAGNPVHPDDLGDYKRAMESGSTGPLPGWLRKLFGD